MEFFNQCVVDAKESTKKQLKGGIDAHKRGCNICLFNKKEEIVKAKRISTNYESLDKFFTPLLKDYDVEVAIEVGNLSFTICDNLSFLKVDSFLVNPLKNRLIADSCQKSDKRDAKTLGFQLLKGMLPPRVYHPTYPERELRSLVNHRHKLIGDRTRIANRTHALLLRNGIFCNKSSLRNHKKYWENLKAEKLSSECETSILGIQFEKYMEQYQMCNKQVEEIEKEVEKKLDSMYRFQYQLLSSIPGVGISIASVVLAYLGILQRFKNVRKFWSYYGMAPKVRESDGKKLGSGGITKMGPSILRGYLTQGALSVLKNKEKKDNKPLVEFYQEIRVKKGWKKARVALAKKILGIIYGVLKNQTAYISNYAELNRVNNGNKKNGNAVGKSVPVPSAPSAPSVSSVSSMPVVPVVPVVPGSSGVEKEQQELVSFNAAANVSEKSESESELELELGETDCVAAAAESKAHRQACSSQLDRRERVLSIEEIKSLHMVEFLTHQYGLDFKPLGNQYICLSPFTEEKKPSFTVGQFNGHWLFKDFSSGHGGSLIDFVLLKENYENVGQSLAHLRRAIIGDKLDWLESQRSGSGMVENENEKEKKKKGGGNGGDYNLNYIYRKLSINEKEVCQEYLSRRGIGQELISELSNRGILLHNLYKGHSYCCFAVFDHHGELRCLDNHQVESKGTGKGKFVLGQKHLFSLDWAVLPGAQKVFISEGIIDYLSIKTLEPGLPGVALLGNALNFDESQLQFQSTTVIISALDCDAGGIRALLSLKEKYPQQEISPYNLAGCNDPNEYLQTLIMGKKVKNKMLHDNKKPNPNKSDSGSLLTDHCIHGDK